MDIATSNYSIADILAKLERRELTVNSEYQRGTELWPSGPRSYFIDTILEGFPFPKIYFFEDFDRATMRTRMEIVDGQQRISAIRAFVNNQFSLSLDKTAYRRKRYEDFDDELKKRFMMYTVSVDVIRNATQAEIVEMFRRMNAYTLPLNGAEKRHAGFQGPFKWSIHSLAADLGEFFDNFGVFTNRQMIRMADQELLTEIYLFIRMGLQSSSPTLLNAAYKDNDEVFSEADDFASMCRSAVQYIVDNLPRLRGSYMMKPYAAYTLICALIFNRYGKPALPPEEFPFKCIGKFAAHAAVAEEKLLVLAAAHEANETDGPYKDYVFGSASGTNRIVQRTERFRAVLKALQD